eukprot:CAMPEP_0119339330 /NCGR_PEP_ID=MMETSP1333-20130426/98038_1 /TAXON_ID=418940 /ORGANISM="Scyphosphaera apsteinii, Strain RCC1455" /LENGTH=172 /DNA_ID=CAMNT_0007350829 /DNA_START=52 /DNA_END=570 /DNA_ORIENTATION=-
MARFEQMHGTMKAALGDSRALVDHIRGYEALQQQLAELLEEAQDSTQLLQEAQEARLHTYYKVVANINGRYLSVFDGQTEFRMGERVARKPCHGHRGAFFLWASAADARSARFPRSSKLKHADRALLRVRGDLPHSKARHAHGSKCMLWTFTPCNDVSGMLNVPGQSNTIVK